MKQDIHADTAAISQDRYEHLWRVAPWLFVLLWAGGYSFAKLGLAYIEPMTLLALRYGIAVALLVPLMWLLKAALPVNRQHWLALIVTGFLIQSVYFGLAYLAMKDGMGAGTTALILSLQPILVAFLAPLLVGERITRLFWLGLLLGFGGTLIVVFANYTIEAVSLFAVSMAVCALAGITTATLFEKRYGQKTHPVTNAFVQYCVGFITLLPVALWLEEQTVIWHHELFIALAYLVIGNSLIAISLLIGLIRRGAASKVSALFYLVPPLAVLLAWVILGEVMPPLSWLGFVFCVAGIIVVNRSGSDADKSQR
ncbi:MAG: DMT family transporter [Thiolinea sp.]